VRGLPLYAIVLCVAAPPAQAAWPHDSNNGNVAVCTAVDGQYSPAIVPDGTGGAFVAWEDNRSGTSSDIYVQRLDATGVPQWTPNGVPVCSAIGAQSAVAMASDGTGGAIVAWTDRRNGNNDIYASASTPPARRSGP